MKLATKISLTVAGVLALGALSSVHALFVAQNSGRILEVMVVENVSSVRAAEELEIALLEQRGLVASYILDNGNPQWIEELQAKKAAFSRWQTRAEETAHTDEERRLLRSLRAIYEEYDARREEVIALYKHGDGGHATQLILGEVNDLYGRAYETCEGFIAANERFIEERSMRVHGEVQRASVTVAALVVLTLATGAGLLALFFRGVLLPLRRMAENARAFSQDNLHDRFTGSGDELHAVGSYLRLLMSDVVKTQTHLERSQLQLLDSDRLASMGRLAASISHEIRNPLTSIEMRLHSIGKVVGDDPEVEEDLRVVSEEIAHLENTVRNVLEFSRPPHPDLRAHAASDLIDKTMELCRHWLTERGVTVVRRDDRNLPAVRADSEQIKQVLLNLLRNAAEAMGNGGTVHISIARAHGHDGREMVVVRVQDTGPGVAPEARGRILDPFFSTKSEGTGLGLCIAARIMAQHEGRLELEPQGERGASFAVWIPIFREA